jgi:hypothetical protein
MVFDKLVSGIEHQISMNQNKSDQIFYFSVNHAILDTFGYLNFPVGLFYKSQAKNFV